MRYKKGNEYYDGKSIVYNGKRYISPSEAILLAAGYVKEEPQVIEPTTEEQIWQLKERLAATDYKVIKVAEYAAAGLPAPYDIAQLHTERQGLRDEINELEGGGEP